MKQTDNPWPFSAWHNIAIEQFHLSPSEFWNMPIGDWLGLISAVRPSGMSGHRLGELLTDYPDEDPKK